MVRSSFQSSSSHSPPRIALLGNPNSGKTTLFNALTGLRYKVGNYPGVTVERREGTIRLGGHEMVLADLPGVYCLDGHSIDERVTVSAVKGELGDEAPDLLLLVLDGTMLERGMYLVAEALEKKLPVVVVLTMMDLVAKRGERIRVPLLQARLGVPVVALRSRRPHDSEGGDSFDTLGDTIIRALQKSEPNPVWPSEEGGLLESDAASARYRRIAKILDGCIVRPEGELAKQADRLDAALTHPVGGMVIFIAMMAVLFQLVFSVAALPMGWIDGAVTEVGAFVGGALPQGLFRSLLVDGLIAGMGSVLVFLPQIGLLFLLLSLLEESGYLVRAALLMDAVLRRIGLQGRSFIPLLSSFACAIPGIMSTRVIGSTTDRLITILVAPLMSCSARLPVYTLLISAFFPEHYIGGFISLRGAVLFGLYVLGIAGAALVAFVASRLMKRGEPSVFVMEMPSLRLPSVRAAAVYALDRVLVFLRTTGPVIMSSSILLWALASFPGESIDQSFAGLFGRFVQPLFAPLGFSWEVCVAILCSFAAREVFVSALGTILNISSGEAEAQTIASLIQDGHVLTFPAGMAALVFFIFACQCISTLAIVRRETASWRWPATMFVYMMVLAWGGGWAAYEIASWWQG